MDSLKVSVAFYRYKRPVGDIRTLIMRLLHEATCLLTRSQFSHCEIVYNTGKANQRNFICDSASARDGGVRRKLIRLWSSRWVIVDTQQKAATAEYFYYQQKGRGYDYLGAMRAVIPFLKESKTRWYCSEYVAAAMNLPAEAGKTPQTLYDHLRSNK